MDFFPSLWLWLYLLWAPLVALAVTVPAPISVATSERWEGNDGPWSTFTFRVGTPAQDVRLLIGMAGQETWAVGTGGCAANEPSNCPDLRGNLFNLNASSTWVSTTTIWNNTGYYILGNEIGNDLGIDPAGEYGFDTVGLSYSSTTEPTLNRTIVAMFIDTAYYLGQFGISPRPTNFTVNTVNSSALDDPQPSYLSLLKSNGDIPSLSWGYQTGSYYRSQTYSNAYGSLVLGGYDTSRYSGTPLSMDMGTDDGRELVVGIQAINYQSVSESSSLLQTPILAALDSTQPNIWLPADTCALFEEAFGITWNDTAQMYFLNSTLHSTLLAQNASVTFKLGAATTGGNTTSITLPYGAFDLTASFPLAANSTPYFPLKRAANSTQYTLGRAFMQEAYIFADYERRNFSLASAQWPPGTEYLVAIQPVANSSSNGTYTSNSSSGLSGGAIAGIVVGAVVVILLVVGIAAVILIRRRKSRGDSVATEKDSDEQLQTPQAPTNESNVIPKPELDGRGIDVVEMDHKDAAKVEMDGLEGQRTQLDGYPIKPPVEMAAGDLPSELLGSESATEMGSSQGIPTTPGPFELDAGQFRKSKLDG